jgi:predicted TIM-barrel fold metal-dependent hydrolase
MQRKDFRAGLARLTALGLSLDAWVFHPQLADVVDLARSFPDASIILGHCGGPLGYGPYGGRRDEVYATWKAGILELATCPNVTMKLGGMMMRLAAFDYGAAPAPITSSELAARWRPYIELCIERFGADRCMFESNFPVDKMGIGYAALWNALKRIAAGASAAEKLALFNGTARRAYRLE